MNHESASRRAFLKQLGQGALATSAIPTMAGLQNARANNAATSKADSCIFVWLGGGACHLDMWDPKRRGDGKKKAGSAYDAIDTAIGGVQVSEHLSKMAPLMDRCVPIRSLHHDVVDEHAAATNRVHTGRPTSGTIIYPSIGSVVSEQLGSGGDGVPAYVVMGYPNITRGPGFLGAKYGYVYLTETALGPRGLQRPPGVSDSRHRRRQDLLAKLRDRYLRENEQDRRARDYIDASIEGFRLTGPNFMKVFNLANETASLRESYGSEFGQRCLLARRLVQSGVRFVEVSFNLNFINGSGWDTHNEGQLKQHLLIQDLDRALATLITDLERVGRLDRTLIVVATEFGRPPEFDARGGRGHQSEAFSVLIAGGGLNTGQAIGSTDELGKRIADTPVSVPDLHATMYHALGIDPSEELFDSERPIPITDGGTPIAKLFS